MTRHTQTGGTQWHGQRQTRIEARDRHIHGRLHVERPAGDLPAWAGILGLVVIVVVAGLFVVGLG